MAPTQPARKVHASPPARRIWDGFARSRQYATSTSDWFVSHGHYAETSEALVRVSPEAFEQYQEHTVGGEFEPGSTLVMLHRSRVDRKPGRVHVMQREPSGWYYLVLEADGAIVEQGALPRCAGCHADAVSDSVFGPPRSEAPE